MLMFLRLPCHAAARPANRPGVCVRPPAPIPGPV